MDISGGERSRRLGPPFWEFRT